MTDFQQFIDLVQAVGMWIIGFALFMNERKAHDDTRRLHMADLREIAGMSPRLQRLNNDSDKLSQTEN